jgi:hypothetical protein
MMIEFKVGAKVWGTGKGNGVVMEPTMGKGDTYPVCVEFEDGASEDYTTEGLLYEGDPLRSLFLGHDLKVVGEQIPVERWIMVFDDESIYETPFHNLEDALITQKETEDNGFTVRIIKIEL